MAAVVHLNPGAVCGHAVGFRGELGFSSDPTHATLMWPPAAVSFEAIASVQWTDVDSG